MKNRILSFLLVLVILLPTLTLFACSGPSFVKANRLLEVMEGTLRSAYYQIPTITAVTPSQGSGGGASGGEGGGGANGGASGGGAGDKNPGPSGSVSPQAPKIYNAARVPLSSYDYLAELSAVVDGFLGVNGGVPLTEDNKKALAGEALSEGSPFAGMLRAMIAVYGDGVFSTNYSTGGVTFAVIDEEGDSYTIRGVMQDEGGFRSAITMTFEKVGERYSYIFAKYSINGDESFPLSTLNIATYESEAGMLCAELRANKADIFSSYDRAYADFSITSFTGACFAMDNYAAYDLFDASEEQVRLLMDFARDTLGFTNETFATLAATKPGREITGKDALTLAEITQEAIYVSPYYYETNETYVRDSYVVPADVTVVKTASIPAARVIYIHGNVEKIESKPFQAPQYVEEIVFVDPTGGKLTEIGSFDANLGNPSFLLSMTKVKRFTLPASVKKLELGEYVLNTEVELIDLSAYDPAWLDDPSLMTCTYNDFWKDDHSRATFKESAYANLTLCGTESFFFREVRYIHELRMPQFNMSIAFKDITHLNIISEEYGEYYAEAYQDVYRAFYAFTGDEGSFARFDEFVAMKGYTRTFSSIGTLVMHDNTRIATDEMLFGEFGIGDEEEKEEDWKDGEKEEDKYKDDKDKINATHKLLELTLYRDMMDKGHSPDEPPFVTYPTVEKILIPASLYDALASEEGRQYDGIHQYDGMPEVVRVVVEVK